MLLLDKCFESEEAALQRLEQVAWPEHPVCPHCEHVGPAYDLKKTRAGLRKCRKCGLQFTVRIGTAFERSHVPTHKWLQAILLLSVDKRLSARRLSRILDVSYKSAWYLAQRITAASVARGPLGSPSELSWQELGGEDENDRGSARGIDETQGLQTPNRGVSYGRGAPNQSR